MRFSRLFFAIALSVVLAGCGQTDEVPSPSVQSASVEEQTRTGMVGHWQSVDGEQRPMAQGATGYLKRDFTNSPDLASATLVFYLDSTYTDKNFTLLVEGPYEIIGPSEAVEGAAEVDFSFNRMVITPHSQGMVDYLNTAEPNTCGEDEWQPDVEQDVTSTGGCSVFGVDLSTYREYDLVKVEGDLLYYGARPADGSAPDSPDKRPTSLQPPLRKVQ